MPYLTVLVHKRRELKLILLIVEKNITSCLLEEEALRG
jgi:hypothetical protein